MVIPPPESSVMPHTPHEDRFIGVLQYMTGRELAQEISIPRKARRLDAMCRFGATPVHGFLARSARLALVVR